MVLTASIGRGLSHGSYGQQDTQAHHSDEEHVGVAWIPISTATLPIHGLDELETHH